MNKEKIIGICCLLVAVVLAAAFIYRQRAEDGDNYGVEPGGETGAVSSAVSGYEVNVVQPRETAEGQLLEPSEETEELEHGEYSGTGMDIKGLDQEVLSLMNVTKERLAKEIRIFANGYGFAGMTEVSYYGETVIDHKKDTVSVVFYFELPETGTYKFNVIFQRKRKTFRIEPW
ncbi:MAG: hypothetical protein NC293_03060 [Roseburia sp.]|nr:hypothetical protein [Roseburia sp.]